MKTTFVRYFSTALTVLLLALLALGVSFQLLAKAYLTRTALNELRSHSEVIATLVEAYHSEGAVLNRQFLVNLDVASRISGADAVICDPSGMVTVCSDTITGSGHTRLRADPEYVKKVVENGYDASTGIIRGLYEDSRYVVSTPITDSSTGQNLGIVMVSRPTASTTQVLSRLSDLFVTVSLIVVIIASGVMLYLTRRQNSPLKQMAAAARSFGHGDLTARVVLQDSYPEEIEDLALAFNNMASTLQKSEYQRQEFVANVSHELKTPMTTISGYVDGILDGTIPPERQRHYLQIVSDETKRLSRLVRSMLDISRLQDQGGIPEDRMMRFDLEECAGQVLVTFEQKINGKKLNVDVNMPEHPVFTHACRDYVTQVIYNLLDNAVKFCPEGGTLGLTIREGGSKAYISISNDGDTIPPEELPLVFDRFHKLDKSRSQNRDGWGLGLYIVKTIVCSHGENISVTSRDGKTEFTFTMPLVN